MFVLLFCAESVERAVQSVSVETSVYSWLLLICCGLLSFSAHSVSCTRRSVLKVSSWWALHVGLEMHHLYIWYLVLLETYMWESRSSWLNCQFTSSCSSPLQTPCLPPSISIQTPCSASCPPQPEDLTSSPTVTSTVFCTPDLVRRQLMRLHSGKAAGLDGVLLRVLKACAPQLSGVLSQLSTWACTSRGSLCRGRRPASFLCQRRRIPAALRTTGRWPWHLTSWRPRRGSSWSS